MKSWLAALTIVGIFVWPRTAASQFIVKDQQYRCPTVDPQCAGSLTKLPAFEQHEKFTINFVEVNDNGDLWDPRQLEEALAQIGTARDGGREKPIVFVYIHGWQNNANEVKNDPSETDCLKLHGDVAKFKQCGVGQLADSPLVLDPSTGKHRPVVGIFLAWRGLSSSIEPFKHFFSYWPRRNKARLVGRRGMFQALDGIVKKVGEHRDDYTVLMIGHSFGARVLEYAAEAVDPGQSHCGFMERFRRSLSGVSATAGRCPVNPAEPTLESTRPPVDLFFYVNAATSHRMTWAVLHNWESLCTSDGTNPVCKADPMYLATSSRTDYATTFLMPVANAVWPALRADRYHLISAANTPWLHTHRDPKRVEQQNGDPCQLPLSPDSFCFEYVDNEGKPVKYYVKAHDDEPQSRFWILNTGHRLIRNHGDVWNPRVFGMILAVLQRTLRAPSSATTLAAPAAP